MVLASDLLRRNMFRQLLLDSVFFSRAASKGSLMSSGPLEKLTTEIAPERYDQAVSDLPPTSAAAPVPPPWPAGIPPTRSRQWPMFALLVVALLVTLGVAIVGWFRPEPAKPLPAPTYSNQQVADAKAKVCGAYGKIHHAVLANTGRSGGSDPTATLAVAANARIALYDGGEYLMKTLAQEPATPAELAEATRALVNAYQQLAVDYMAEATDPEINSAFQAVETTGSKVSGMCK
jgi:hypothetical protein